MEGEGMMFDQRMLLLVIGCLALMGVSVLAAAAPDRVDICHIPPGEPDNVHTITISESALQTHLDHGDTLGPCAPDRVAKSSGGAACACPKPGVWRVTNLDGWMECPSLGMRRTLRGAGENDGAIWILDDDCSTIFSEAYEREREDVIMDRGRDCLFFGTAPGEESGAKAIFDGAYKLESDVLITGEYYMEMSGMGMACEGYRPFKIDYLEPLNPKKYERLERKMRQELEQAQQTLEDHRGQIDEYLQRTNGGKALGGRNP